MHDTYLATGNFSLTTPVPTGGLNQKKLRYCGRFDRIRYKVELELIIACVFCETCVIRISGGIVALSVVFSVAEYPEWYFRWRITRW